MKKLVFIAPHLSTGGLPQYLYKQIESIKDHFDVYCIEWENVTGGVLVVQRNRIEQLLKDKLITLPEDKNTLFTLLNTINPDIVHLQEIPELFMADDIAKKLYTSTRTYSIIETSHDSSTDVNSKRFFPDKFLMVSNYQIQQYKSLGIPCELVEHPIEYKTKTKTREQALRDLGLDPNLKHVVNVGLFTPRKNQAEVIEYAKKLKDYPIQFHFIGNQADNFKFYWEPLMKDFPPNCKWWNERNDVDSFYEAADLFLFTSRGTITDKETMPLVIREAIGWKIPSLIYNLPVYLNYFDKFNNIQYLDFNSNQTNVQKIVDVLGITKKQEVSRDKSCVVVSSYPKTTVNTNLTKECIKRLKSFGLTVILTTHCDVSDELFDLADHVIIDANNILTKHTFYERYWYRDVNVSVELDIRGENNNVYHGPAAYTNYYNGVLLASRLGFDNIYCTNFDIILKDDTIIKASEDALKRTNGFVGLFDKQEGKTINTEWVAFKPEFFLRMFPHIKNENDYTEWFTQVNAESNGLENILYHTIKNNLHEVTTLDETSFYDLFGGPIKQISSQVEYSTVLPIKDDNNNLVIWYNSSNTVDGRTLKIWENNTLLDTISITELMAYYLVHPKTTNQTFKFEFIDTASGKTISTKQISIDETYNLNKNGLFTYENR